MDRWGLGGGLVVIGAGGKTVGNFQICGPRRWKRVMRCLRHHQVALEMKHRQSPMRILKPFVKRRRTGENGDFFGGWGTCRSWDWVKFESRWAVIISNWFEWREKSFGIANAVGSFGIKFFREDYWCAEAYARITFLFGMMHLQPS